MSLLRKLVPRGGLSANSTTENLKPASMTEDGEAESTDLAEPLSGLSLSSTAADSHAARRSTIDLTQDTDWNHIMYLPRELREIMYEHVVTSGLPILPYLCDTDNEHGPPKFHDDNARRHDSVYTLLSITRVSRRIREESLQVFYTKNSFAVGPDTITYLTYLESVGRFDLVRRISLAIPCQSEKFAAWVLRCVTHFDEKVAAYERDWLERMEDALVYGRTRHGSSSATTQGTSANREKTIKTRKPLTAAELRRHPRYLVGGHSDVNLAILLRMLSTTSAADSDLKRRLVLPVSNADAIRKNSGLCWFPSTMRALEIELRFVVRPASATLDNRRLTLEWRRRFQGQGYAGNSVASVDIMKNAKEMHPDMEGYPRPRKTCYYRRSCQHPGAITWFNLDTPGGGRM